MSHLVKKTMFFILCCASFLLFSIKAQASADYYNTDNCFIAAAEAYPANDMTEDMKKCYYDEARKRAPSNDFSATHLLVLDLGKDSAPASDKEYAKKISLMASYAYYHNNKEGKPDTTYCNNNGVFKDTPIWCGRLRQLVQMSDDGKYRNFKCGQKETEAEKKRCQLLADNFKGSAEYCDQSNGNKNHCQMVMPLLQSAKKCQPDQSDDTCLEFASNALESENCDPSSFRASMCVALADRASDVEKTDGKEKKDKEFGKASVDPEEAKPVDPIAGDDSNTASNNQDSTGTNQNGGLGGLGDLASNLANSLFGNKDKGEVEKIDLPQIDAKTNIRSGGTSFDGEGGVDVEGVNAIGSAYSPTRPFENARFAPGKSKEQLAREKQRQEDLQRRMQAANQNNQPPPAGGRGGGAGGNLGGGASNPNKGGSKKPRRRGSGGLDKVADALGGNRYMSADGARGGGGSAGEVSAASLQSPKSKGLSQKIKDRIAQNRARNMDPRRVNAAFQAGLNMSEQQRQELSLPVLFFPEVNDRYEDLKNNNDYLNQKGL